MIERANLEVFADTLLELAKKDKDIIVVTSDSRGSGKLVQFGKELPKQIIEVGIAEQNLVGICAGLSAAGKKVFGVSPSSFLTARSLEQIKNDIAYSDHPVTLVGISAGISYGQLGSTHHSIHDLAVLRTINNIDIVVPADNFETKEVTKIAVDYPKPLFIRFGKKPMLKIHKQNEEFQIGKAIEIIKGKDITFLAIGETVQRAYLASAILKEKNISSSIISMHTLRPFDESFFLKSITNTKALITVEEHSTSGGIGEKCAGIILQNQLNILFRIVGIPDEYMINGSQSDVLDYYDMEPNKLALIARKLLNR
jgi:transketolase